MGKTFAQLKRGSYYDNPNAIYPTIGDFVMIEWNDSGDSMILETLKQDLVPNYLEYMSEVESVAIGVDVHAVSKNE